MPELERTDAPHVTAFLTQLAQCLTQSEWTTQDEAIERSCIDWRKRYHTTALAVITPKSTQTLQAAVRLCHAHHICMTAQGGNTGLVGGAVPLQSDTARPHVVIRTTNLRQSIDIDPANLTLTADAGFTLQEVQQAAAEAGYLFPLSLASEGSCTLGGNLASNAGGVAVLRYGNTRELCLGLQFVSAEGQLCGDLRGLRKNNTGYDLRHLLIGSEGTLGLITKACMRIYPAPQSKVVVWMNVSNLNSAVSLLQVLQSRLFNELSSYEWMNANAIALVQTHFEVSAPGAAELPKSDHVLAEFSSLVSQQALQNQVEAVLGDILEREESGPLGLLNVFVAQSLSEGDKFWSVRENISEAQAKEGLNVKHDIACAVSKLPEFHDAATKALEATGLKIRPILFGHLGDGNLHYNLSAPAGENSKDFLKQHQTMLNEAIHQAIINAGGTVSAEHGIGQLKASLLKEITEPMQYEMLVRIKNALDPKGLLNPGKLLQLD